MKIVPLINSQPFGTIQPIRTPDTSQAPTVEGKRFIDLLEDMNQTQNNAQTAVYDLLTKGVGQTHDVLIQQKKAEAQMKTAAVVRDHLIENYKQLLNMQI
ncbi:MULTISPECIES: flagellar hook-basal body complex protein FliE [Bacillus cereus group]|uniref:flagellar hook-basal body complex protein FliE n=1 Tax=Bacillus cereus group TaxID=86661 RepID=UPI000864022D|nr:MULTISPECIES: flagellar hook-basal body complex protein FliE [Bacillus cereus group]AWC28298.1 flagellar hook-basal body complex protein FliE [Bacillus cytotoxicus]AWC40317.1 flagellar hook-basal body complex protein FliE [Bacillus cytotoxicus]AWC48248.1 flagellar hook-basal body complex protein FliE [Bacillus cytotoxicus]AWC52365.1 flagellar hook-basal body complex protein FliE [Bacillus cytotoxicus]AWC56499.1 flagellar hook-basal body complex protein FliE [Bacillus cytotoxicus]